MTPHDREELIRRTSALWSEGKLDATLELIDPEARWEPSGKFIGTGEVFEGHQGVRQFWDAFREPWESVSLEPDEFTELDESRMLTRTRFRGVGRSSGLVTETELFAIWTVEGDKITRYQSFGDRSEALDAAGQGGVQS